jgi:hypothetical protein
MQYVIQTKTEGRTLASLQPSREEAAEFWAALTGDDPVLVLDTMRGTELAQEGDSHAHTARRVFVLDPPGGGYPQMLWGEKAAELSGLTLIHHEDHKSEALG